jgi:transposase
VLTLIFANVVTFAYNQFMKITPEQYEKIADSFPRQRGNVSINNLSILNAILYVAENGCKWRALPQEFGNWHTIYTRMNRWAKSGALDKIFSQLQKEQLIQIKIESVSLDSTYIRVHPDGTGALKKTGNKPSENPEAGGRQKLIWLPQVLNAR